MRSQTVSKLSTPTSACYIKHTQSDSPYPRIFTPINSSGITDDDQKSLLPILDEIESYSAGMSPKLTSQMSQVSNVTIQSDEIGSDEVVGRRIIDEKKLLDGIEAGINWEEARKYSATRVRESESGEQTVECTWSEFKMRVLNYSDKSEKQSLRSICN